MFFFFFFFFFFKQKTAYEMRISDWSSDVCSSDLIARAALRVDYEEYLVRQRGISPRTIYHAWRFADRFLDHRFGDGEAKLAAISAGDVVSFLQHLLGRTGPYRDQPPATTMPAFLHNLFHRGVTTTNLAMFCSHI